jgi:aminopeptidase N
MILGANVSNPLPLRASIGRIIVLAALLFSTATQARDFQESHSCRYCSAAFAAPDSPDFRKFAPDRKADILHLALDVTPDFQTLTVAGTATLKLKPIGKPLDELRLDAIRFNVLDFKSSVRATHHTTDDAITVTFAKPVPVGEEISLTIRYTAQPKRGLYFRTPANGYPAGDLQLWTQGEPHEARHWFPGHDYPNEKFTSEITCHVPEGITVLANGRQVSAAKDAKTGLVAVRWLQEKPHVNYLIALCAGKFVELTDTHRDVPLRFYAPPSEAAVAKNSFRGTREMMAFFERELGVPYPWAEYKQVVALDYHWGGMENTTITVLTQRTLHEESTEPLVSSENLVAHELAHQWFGDYLTCKDWSHLWLNEGFATYYALLYGREAHGEDWFNYHRLGDARNVLAQTNTTRGMVWKQYDEAQQMFDYFAYPKGGWVLHMLRSQLGDELYRRCITTYLQRHALGNVTTDDLLKVIEELSGRSFDGFFDQWVYRAAHPVLDVTWSWDAKKKLAKVSVKQTQKISTEVPLFRFPLPLRFKSGKTTVNQTVQVTEKEHDFYVALKDAPEIVRIDPDLTVLAKINFKPSNAMLYAQLADKTDALGRVLAAEQLGDKTDSTTVAKLKTALQTDAFYPVRVEAAAALKKIHTGDALIALLASLEQPDARARNAVIDALGGFLQVEAQEAILKNIGSEKNPAIVATATRGLGLHDSEAARSTIERLLNRDSHQQRLTEAAIAAIRKQDDPTWTTALRERIAAAGDTFHSRSLATALDTLAFINRNEAQKREVREFLATYLLETRDSARIGAITALGTLGDDAAIPTLEPFAQGAAEAPETKPAEAAIAKLRNAQKPTDNLRDLRKELETLKKNSDQLRKDFDTLKKQSEARNK